MNKLKQAYKNHSPGKQVDIFFNGKNKKDNKMQGITNHQGQAQN